MSFRPLAASISVDGNTEFEIPHDNLDGSTIYIANGTDGTLTVFSTADRVDWFGTIPKRTATAISVATGVDEVHQLEGQSSHLRLTVASRTTGSVVVNLMLGGERGR